MLGWSTVRLFFCKPPKIVFIGEHVSSCVCVHVHTRMYIDIYCKYIVFIMLYTHTYNLSNFMYCTTSNTVLFISILHF